jgi:hypothetical protein
VCTPTSCVYVLKKPIEVQFGKDANIYYTPGGPQKALGIAGRFAAGNYNYRHVSLSVNLVGTAVHDCDGVAASLPCYSSGFEEFSLRHRAFDVGLLNAINGVEHFDFGSQSISHGKALAAEKYITIPIGNGDAALLSQPSIEKVELAGRPLDGQYQLVIFDSPSLRWDRLEDVQIILHYRYWAP